MKKIENQVCTSLKKIVREFGTFSIRGERVLDAPCYSDPFTFILTGKNLYGSKKGFTAAVELSGQVHGGEDDNSFSHVYEGRTIYDAGDSYRPIRGFWYLSGNDKYLRTAVESIPDDASVSLEVYLDWGASQILRPLKIHVDNLVMKACWKRGKRMIEREFFLDMQTGFHNSARFGGNELQFSQGSNGSV